MLGFITFLLGLAVADELPMDFLNGMNKSLKTENSDAIIIGEVWEDASNKVSYGNLRNYCYGDTLDSVMNYPVRKILLDFIMYGDSSAKTIERLNSLLENYPSPFLHSAMNLLGSHDCVRIRTVMSGAPDPDKITRENQALYIPDEYSTALSAARVKCAAAFLFVLPGVPCIYYGDEVGITGMSDPFNRSTYPWGKENKELLEFFSGISNMRKDNRTLICGDTFYCALNDDIIACLCKKDNYIIYTIINRNVSDSYDIHFKLPFAIYAKSIFSNEFLETTGTNENCEYSLNISPLSFYIFEGNLI